MADLAGSEGLDVPNGPSGGAPEDAGAAVGQLDRQRLVDHVDGDGLVSVDPAESDLLPDDHDDAGVAGPAPVPAPAPGGVRRDSPLASSGCAKHLAGIEHYDGSG